MSHIHIEYEDDNTETYMVAWDCDCDYKNDKQVYHLTQDGNILFYSYIGDQPNIDLDDLCVSIDFKADMNK